MGAVPLHCAVSKGSPRRAQSRARLGGEAALNAEGAPGREGEGVFGKRLYQSPFETGQWKVHSLFQSVTWSVFGQQPDRELLLVSGTQWVRPGPVPTERHSLS